MDFIARLTGFIGVIGAHVSHEYQQVNWSLYLIIYAWSTSSFVYNFKYLAISNTWPWTAGSTLNEALEQYDFLLQSRPRSSCGLHFITGRKWNYRLGAWSHEGSSQSNVSCYDQMNWPGHLNFVKNITSICSCHGDNITHKFWLIMSTIVIIAHGCAFKWWLPIYIGI